MIELKNLGKTYDRQIFSKLDLQFQKNELVVFLGPSGSGKSTLLKIMSGLEAPTVGSVQGLQNKKKSVVFQEPRLLPWLTCAENIRLFNKGESARIKSESWMKKLGLSQASKRFPQQLSGGMKMRASIARSLMEDPEILFLDEPFSALDEPTRFFLQEEFRKLYEQNSWSVFFVTHSIEEACFLASQIVVFQGPDEKPFVHLVPLPKTRTKELRADIAYFNAVNELRERVEKAWKKDATR